MTWSVTLSDCIEAMAAMEPDSVDAIVTDPPYGLGFMGKAWDDLPPGLEWATECLRVLKPGGHLLAFGGTRTYHRLTCAIEDAGFEVRDCLAWMYGSGFPKSLDVSKAIDKGAPDTDEAKEWDGWGTALRPAFEPIVMARKPLAGTVAANVLAHGTGALNIDGTRVGTATKGRWPANVILDEEAGALLDAQSGDRPSGTAHVLRRGGTTGKGMGYNSSAAGNVLDATYGDRGGASRFFYTPKASTSERQGNMQYGASSVANSHPTVKPVDLMQWLCRLVTPPGGTILDPFTGSGSTGIAALREGFDFIGIEREPEYAAIARARIIGDAPLFNTEGTEE